MVHSMFPLGAVPRRICRICHLSELFTVYPNALYSTPSSQLFFGWYCLPCRHRSSSVRASKLGKPAGTFPSWQQTFWCVCAVQGVLCSCPFLFDSPSSSESSSVLRLGHTGYSGRVAPIINKVVVILLSSGKWRYGSFPIPLASYLATT